MKIDVYLFKYKNKLNDLQKSFLLNVYYKDFGEKGLDLIIPEFEIEKPDGTGHWRIDFVIKTKFAKYAIECDGLYYHASGAVTREYFDNLQNKQNEIQSLGFKLIRFTNNLIRCKPEECIWELRRSFIADKELFEIYLNRNRIVTPHEVQKDALLKLEETRKNGLKKGIVILATGLGKTFLAGLDVKKFNPKKTLFIVHQEEILKQSLNSFQEVMPEKARDMGFFVGGKREKHKAFLFASIQALSRQKNLDCFKENEFDYIIFDETHHNAAPTYKKVFDYFKPKFILGLTATPERMDRQEILPFYDNNVVFEMGQEEAIKKGLLVPFHYYGFKDNVDYSDIYFNGFKYDINDLNRKLLIEERDNAVIRKFKEMAKDKKAIGFCASVEHADWCAEQFRKAGINAISIHSKLDESEGVVDTKDSNKLIENFKKGKYQIAFVVNMFNEGVDIPDVECLLFLRPTESKTIFIQHLGRGLRISPGKDKIIVLDFIGNYRTAGMILSGLGLKKGVGELKKEKIGEKEIYFYNNNGCKVIFESEVVEIFKKLASDSTKEVRKEAISEEWIEYAEYLEKWTENNLYWKRGQQNQNFDVQLEGLNLIDKNPSISESEFIKNIQDIVRAKYPGKDMTAGFRALILSKVAGLVTAESPLKVTAPFREIRAICKGNFKSPINYLENITHQIEKILYWNSIYGTYSKYVSAEKRVSFKDFKIYPFFFTYDVLLRLIDEYGYDNTYLSETEFNSFLAVTKNHSETEEVTDRIVKFRNYEEHYELEKLLNQKNKIDPRFYKILHYNKYLIVDKHGVKLNEKLIGELRVRMNKFRELLKFGKLILFNELTPESYFKLLYSTKDLIDYHGN